MNPSEFKAHNEETLSPVSYVGPDQYENAAGETVSSGGSLFRGYVNLRNTVDLTQLKPKVVGKNKPKYYINGVAFCIENPATGEEHIFTTSASLTEKMYKLATAEDQLALDKLDNEESYYAYIQHLPKRVNGDIVPGQWSFFVTLTPYTDAGLVTTDIDFSAGLSAAATDASAAAEATAETAPAVGKI